MMHLRDHKVRFRSEGDIVALAETARARFGVDSVTKVSVARILRELTQIEFPKKGKLQILSMEKGQIEPCVKYNPLRLYGEELFEPAELGDEEANYKLAHELAHIIMHDHYAQPFSHDPSVRLKSVMDEERAEWQANRFAYHFLVPNKWVIKFFDIETIAITCNVTRGLASERLLEVKSTRKYIGEACENCSNFTVVRNSNNEFHCDACGTNYCK